MLAGLLVTNRVLCLVPFVAWFEDWMFIRKFKVLSFYWYIPVEVTGKCRCKGSSITINYWYNKNQCSPYQAVTGKISRL